MANDAAAAPLEPMRRSKRCPEQRVLESTSFLDFLDRCEPASHLFPHNFALPIPILNIVSERQ